MARLTISIVNYNGGEFLINCLKSLDKVIGEEVFEVVVLDNASSDDSFDRAKKLFPKFIYIQSGENLGFGKGHNRILKEAKTEYLLILNPDTVLEKGVISGVLGFLDENIEVGAATCKIILPGNKIDLTAHRGFPTPLSSLLYFLGDDSLYHLKNADMQKPHEVDAISGAFFMTRKKVMEEVGYFDEDYFMFAEDIDLCYKIKQKGYKVYYLPQFSILHSKGVSTGLKKHSQAVSGADFQTKRKSLDAFYETMKIFYRKHYEKKTPFIINWLVYLGINLRWLIAKKRMVV